MAQTVDVTPPLSQDGASKHFIYFAILISAFHLIANLNDNAQIAGCALIVLLCCVFFIRAMATTYFRSLFEVVFGAILFGYLTQILGEIVGAWATSRLMLSLAAAATMLTVIAKSKIRKYDRASLFAFVAVPALFSTGWIFLLSLRTETLVNFLGFGYDNAAHLAQVGLIVDNNGTTMVEGGVASIPTFLQDTAQAVTSTVATLAELTSTSSESTSKLLVAFSLITILIPVLLTVGILFACSKNQSSWISSAFVTISSLLIFGTGYLSRIWFSGYLASNLGTLLLALIAMAIVLQTFRDPIVYVCAVLMTGHVYPLYLPIGCALLIIPFAQWMVDIRKQRVHFMERLSFSTAILALFLGALFLLPVRATNRSFGGSQFLVDGGIEYLPSRFLLIWGGLFLIVMSIIFLRFEQRYKPLAIVLLSFIGSILVSVYSQSEVGRISYYPTKIVITFIILSISAVLASNSILSKVALRTTTSAIAITAAVTYMIFQPPQKVFVSAFMGEAQTTLSSSFSATPDFVEPTIVNTLSELSLKFEKPVLLISSRYESELNSRWINTLSNQWNDFSWSNWMTIRNLIMDENWSAVADATTNANIIIGTDDKLVFDFLSVSIPNQICLLQTYGSCDFR
jgi:hypothetical protein